MNLSRSVNSADDINNVSNLSLQESNKPSSANVGSSQENALKHLERLKYLIEKERDYVLKEQQELLASFDRKRLIAAGLMLSNLRVTSQRSLVGDKFVLELEIGDTKINNKNSTIAKPVAVGATFRNGDIVELRELKSKHSSESNTIRGTVHRVQRNGVALVIGSSDMDSISSLTFFDLVKVADEISFKRQLKALDDVINLLGRNPFIDMILGVGIVLDPQAVQLPIVNKVLEGGISFFNTSLNSPQKQAIAYALAHELTLIHGPPGTGKTSTIAELILQELSLGHRILVTAPSNVAIDNVLEKMVDFKRTGSGDLCDVIRPLRPGHPSRVSNHLLDYSLDYQVRYSDAGILVRDIRNEIDSILQRLSKVKSKSERREYYLKLKELRAELRQREPKVVSEILATSNPVFCTLSGCGSKILNGIGFETLIIDECCQSLEAECFIGIMKLMGKNYSGSPRLILAGDPHQLPPTVLSKESELEETLFQRLAKFYPASVHLLTIQYRMNNAIQQWSSEWMYGGRLEAHHSVESHLLSELPGIQETSTTKIPVIFYDTSDCELCYEQDEVTTDSDGITRAATLLNSASKFNEGEAKLVVLHLRELMEAGVSPRNIAIISPYSAQVGLLRRFIENEYIEKGCEDLSSLEIGTVDGFQGREKEVIILSLVRTTRPGFLTSLNRLNVSLSRARRHLCIVGSMMILKQVLSDGVSAKSKSRKNKTSKLKRDTEVAKNEDSVSQVHPTWFNDGDQDVHSESSNLYEIRYAYAYEDEMISLAI